MNSSIESLHEKRNSILEQMRALDRMRRGSLSKQFFQSKGPQPSPQQGPYFVLQGYLKGRKFSRRVPQKDVPRVESQVNNYRRFQELAEAFIETTQELTCLEDNEPESKKKLPEEIAGERLSESQAFLKLVRTQWMVAGVKNLEAAEMGLREALLKDGRRLLEQLLNDPQLPVPQNQGKTGEKCYPDRLREVQTVFGTVSLRRNYYYDPETQQGRTPLDIALGLVEGYSPGLVRLACRAAARDSFAEGQADLEHYGGIHLEGRQIHRIVNRAGPAMRAFFQEPRPEFKPPAPIPVFYVSADGTGVPMVAEELEGRAGKQEDGSAKTREVKLGCVFTQTCDNSDLLPLRDPQSTTFVAGFETAADFGLKLRQEAISRGMAWAKTVAFLGDGAHWVWELARVCFPFAIMILDLFHALEHLQTLTDLISGEKTPQSKNLWERWRLLLLDDQVGGVIEQAHQQIVSLSVPSQPLAQKQIAYLENNQARMLYGTYRKKGLFYGSGVVEAGCKTVIGKRFKQSGMFWTVVGAENVLIMRCALYSRRFEEYWDRHHQCGYLDLKTAA